MTNSEVQNYEPIQGLPEVIEEGIKASETMSQSVTISTSQDANPSDSMSESVTVVVS